MQTRCFACICILTILAGCSDPRDEKKAVAPPHEARAASSDFSIPTTLPTDRDPTISEIGRGYKSLRLMTPQPVEVGAAFTVTCIGPSPQQADQSRKTYGIHDGTKINIFMNDRAAATFATSKRSYPIGSIIVKEKQLLGVGGMIKRFPGYDSEHGDWEYFYFENPAKIESGKISSCINCHAGAAGTDHVFGSWSVHQQ